MVVLGGLGCVVKKMCDVLLGKPKGGDLVF